MGVVSTAVVARKMMASRESLEAERSRASLAGMSQLSGLAEMSLEREEGKEGRQEGVWKEYVKADGRKWYYNTETRVMQWTVPEPFCKLDEVRDYPRSPEITRVYPRR